MHSSDAAGALPLSAFPPACRPLVAAVRAHLEAPVEAGWACRVAGWNEAVALAEHHGVTPLIYHACARLPAGAVPTAILTELARRFHDNARRNLYVTGQLLQALTALAAAGIDAVPFKGPMLAIAGHGDLALREFGDLDLLLREQDLDRARAVFERLGYRIASRSQWRPAYRVFGHEAELVRDDDGVLIDLQWRFGKTWSNFALDRAAMWQRLQRVEVGGRAVAQPDLTDLILILSGHGYRHGWSRLKWIVDVAALAHAHRAEWNWEATLAEATRVGGRRLLLLALGLSSMLCGLHLAPEVAAALDADARARALVRRMGHALFEGAGPRTDAHGHLGPVHRILLDLLARERIQDKVPHPLGALRHLAYLARYGAVVAWERLMA